MKYTFLWLAFALAFSFQNISAQSCDCTEYIYLNEPGLSSTLKFEIDPNSVALVEVPAADGSFPWANDGTIITQPHGLVLDLNGQLWIGDTPQGEIRRFNCNGDYTGGSTTNAAGPDDIDFDNSVGALTNMFQANGFIYTTTAQGPVRYDLCTGMTDGVPPGRRYWPFKSKLGRVFYPYR